MRNSRHPPYLFAYPSLELSSVELFVPTFSAGFHAPLGELGLLGLCGADPASAVDATTGDAAAFGSDTEEQRLIQAIAEPISRPSGVHRYRITPYSLGAAVSAGLKWADVVAFLEARCVNWADVADGKTTMPEAFAEALAADELQRAVGVKSLRQQTSASACGGEGQRSDFAVREGKYSAAATVASAGGRGGGGGFTAADAIALSDSEASDEDEGDDDSCGPPTTAHTGAAASVEAPQRQRRPLDIPTSTADAAVDEVDDADGDPHPSHKVAAFVRRCMERYGLVTISFASDGHCYVESADKQLLLRLLGDAIIGSQCRVDPAMGCIRVTVHRPDTAAATATSITSASGTAAASTTEGPTQHAANPYQQQQQQQQSRRLYRAQLLDAVACKVVSERALRLGYPCFHDYDYANDSTVPRIYCDLRPATRPRPYQVAAVEASASAGRCRSGVLVLPCGAGKTLVGVMLVATVKRRVLIVCAGSVSVEQWKNQVLDFATLAAPPSAASEAATCAAGASDSIIMGGGGSGGERGLDGSVYKPVRTGAQRIAVVTSKEKAPITDETDIVITTYSMLSVAKRLYDRLAARVLSDRYARRERRAAGAAAAGGYTSGIATAEGAVAEGIGGVAVGDEDSDEVTLEDIFAFHTTLSSAARAKLLMFRPLGLVILDEVHVVPAECFKGALSALRTKATVGLTATFVREDHRIGSLHHLVGARLFDVGWEPLARAGHLARVMCVEVNVPMTPEFGVEYAMKQRLRGGGAPVVGGLKGGSGRGLMKEEGAEGRASLTLRPRAGPTPATHDTTPLLVMLAAANPGKMRTVLQLAAAHRGDKVLLFCDHILLLRAYARLLGCPVVSGETPHKERMMIFSDFQAVGGAASYNNANNASSSAGGPRPLGGCNMIAISRVGDVSVNLPSANVVIQVSSHGGSRRQEAQRLGRVLRPKDSVAIRGTRQKMLRAAFPPSASVTSPSSSSGESAKRPIGAAGAHCRNPDTEWLMGVLDRGDAADANAYFYSLVTEYSVEVPYATRRSEFLVDQGYPFYSVLAPSPPHPPPQSFCAKIEVAAQQRGGDNASPTTGRRGAGGFMAVGGRAGGAAAPMAPSSVPTISIASLWDPSWRVAFLARIVSGWELRFYSASAAAAHSSSSAPLLASSSAPLRVGGSGAAVKREREEGEEVGGGDDARLGAIERSYAYHGVASNAPAEEAGLTTTTSGGGAPAVAFAAHVTAAPRGVKAEGEAEECLLVIGGGGGEGVDMAALVLADDVVYAEHAPQ